MKLLLTSAGMNVKDELIKILPKFANKIKLAHIITASKPEKNKSYVDKDKQQMIKLGFDVEDIDIEGKNENELRNLLKNKDIIYVQGGNTFYLLKFVKTSGFDKVVRDLINKGIIYVGASAGSYITCPTIEQANWKGIDKNIVGLTDLTGLNLIPFIIFAHFKEKYKSIVEKGSKTTNLPVIAINDNQAVLMIDGKWKIVEKGKKSVDLLLKIQQTMRDLNITEEGLQKSGINLRKKLVNQYTK